MCGCGWCCEGVGVAGYRCGWGRVGVGVSMCFSGLELRCG